MLYAAPKQDSMISNDTVVRHDQVFTSAHAGQREMSLLLCQGSDCCASRNKLLGQFHLRGFQPAPAGAPKIEARYALTLLKQGAETATEFAETKQQPEHMQQICGVSRVSTTTISPLLNPFCRLSWLLLA